jgi:hypothetical protein
LIVWSKWNKEYWLVPHLAASQQSSLPTTSATQELRSQGTNPTVTSCRTFHILRSYLWVASSSLMNLFNLKTCLPGHFAGTKFHFQCGHWHPNSHERISSCIQKITSTATLMINRSFASKLSFLLCWIITATLSSQP